MKPFEFDDNIDIFNASDSRKSSDALQRVMAENHC